MISSLLMTKFTIEFLFLFLSFASLYIAHRPVVMMFQVRKQADKSDALKAGILFTFVGIALGIATMIIGHLWGLVILGFFELILFLISIRIFVKKEQKTFFNELLIVAALTLSAPTSYYSITHTIDSNAISLYLFNFLFFGSTVFYVKMKIELLKSKGCWKENAIKARNIAVVYHILMPIAIISISIIEARAVTVILGFIPMIIQVAAGLISQTSRINFTKIGIGLIVQSVIFLSAIALFWH